MPSACPASSRRRSMRCASSPPRWSAQGFDLPLLIGGATTSRVHTAVKIHPNYHRGQAVYVTDASRAVGAVQSLLSREPRGAYIDKVRAEYARRSRMRMRAAKRTKRACRSRKARANALKLDCRRLCAAQAASLRARASSSTYRCRGAGRPISIGRPSSRPGSCAARFPAILDDKEQGEAARQLYEDAQEMLQANRRPSAGSIRKP